MSHPPRAIARRKQHGQDKFPRGTALGPLTAVVCLLVLSPLGCIDSPATSSQPQPLTVVVSGDTDGWIVPCGCTANQSGGMPRRGDFLRQVQGDGSVAYLDAGGAPADASPYGIAKFEAILRGERLLGIVAHNLGAGELRLGAERLREINQRQNHILVSCNVRDRAGELIVEPLKQLEIAGRRLVIVGVASPSFAAGGLTVDPPLQSILAAIEGRGSADEELIVLAYLPEGELMELASNLPEADLIVGGPTGQSLPPRRVGPTLLATATNKGKFLAVFEASKSDAQVPWSGRIVELDAALADDPEQLENLDQFYRTLAARDFSAAETALVQPLPASVAADYQVAGNQACRECHPAETAAWESSAHAQAWATLEATSAHVDSYCQQCHTTGYGLPGGFVSAARGGERANVGCESCHGPSREHARDPRRHTAYHAQAASACLKCHDRENSPNFEFAEYWNLIRHGDSLPKESEER